MICYRTLWNPSSWMDRLTVFFFSSFLYVILLFVLCVFRFFGPILWEIYCLLDLFHWGFDLWLQCGVEDSSFSNWCLQWQIKRRQLRWTSVGFTICLSGWAMGLVVCGFGLGICFLSYELEFLFTDSGLLYTFSLQDVLMQHMYC